MNVVKEINRINEAELAFSTTASWHDEYKDSAYIFAGGLNTELTEGDVIAIFSQYGEIMDVNMPRDKETGKPRGFAFLMYEDQRSTILAVDNLNGATVLDRTLRVDHVKHYKQPKIKGEDGEWVEPEEQSLNAKPEMMIVDDTGSESTVSRAPSIDPEDPMRDYLIAKRKEEKLLKKSKKSKSKSKHKDETPEERRLRKERKKEKKARKLATSKSGAMKDVEALLSTLEKRDRDRPRNHTPDRERKRRRSGTPPQERSNADSRQKHLSPTDGGFEMRDRGDNGITRGYANDADLRRDSR